MEVSWVDLKLGPSLESLAGAGALLFGLSDHNRWGLDLHRSIHTEQFALAIEQLGQGTAGLDAGLPFFDGDQTVLGLGGDLDLAIDMRSDLLNRVAEQLDGDGTLKTPEPTDSEQDLEAKRISQELAKLYRDGAITGPHDPEARFYARVLRTFGGTYTGKKLH